mmetsp:Transcript_18384/g.59811  ORF Transcript_18384/g.59811 Transcript_18384/m.59811 type:complete len:375 (+) Transcript_18384:1514-2638(+)
MLRPCSSSSVCGTSTSAHSRSASVSASWSVACVSFLVTSCCCTSSLAFATASVDVPGTSFSASSSSSGGRLRSKSSLSETVNSVSTPRSASCAHASGNVSVKVRSSSRTIPIKFSTNPGSVFTPPSVSSWKFCCPSPKSAFADALASPVGVALRLSTARSPRSSARWAMRKSPSSLRSVSTCRSTSACSVSALPAFCTLTFNFSYGLVNFTSGMSSTPTVYVTAASGSHKFPPNTAFKSSTLVSIRSESLIARSATLASASLIVIFKSSSASAPCTSFFPKCPITASFGTFLPLRKPCTSVVESFSKTLAYACSATSLGTSTCSRHPQRSSRSSFTLRPRVSSAGGASATAATEGRERDAGPVRPWRRGAKPVR